jgi:hypothetical protein
MRKGDNVYFFHDRHIYGLGALVDVGGSPTHLNFPLASNPQPYSYGSVKPKLLYDVGSDSPRLRWLCTFKPSPRFFKRGVDMDDALGAHPNAFRMLRVLWKLSFIKLDHEENAALKDVILRANRTEVGRRTSSSAHWAEVHRRIAQRRGPSHELSLTPMLRSAATRTWLRSERALEAALLFSITRQLPSVRTVFGNWDYVSHQVAASPFKPPDWMDKIDVFGASFIRGHAPSLSRLLVMEMKKGKVTADDVEQVMKYVDWVRDEYASGDYSLIRAFLLGYSFQSDAKTQWQVAAERRYSIGRRPPESREWRDLNLVEYRYDPDTVALQFSKV